jgi:hypothetical protein
MSDAQEEPVIASIMIEEEPELKMTVKFINHEDLVFVGEEAKEWYDKIKKQTEKDYDWEKGKYKNEP